MPLLKDGRSVADPWLPVADGEPLPETGPMLLSAVRWCTERETLHGSNRAFGVRLANDQSPDLLADDVKRLALIVLDFPNFADGRAYSQARLLRERFGYRGELRAEGEVLYDQLLLMQRVGFDSFDVVEHADIETALAEMPVTYQPTGTDSQTALSLRRERRRRDAQVAALQAVHGDTAGEALLRAVITESFPGRITVVSSFGAEAVVMLEMVARIDPATPVIFLDTDKHFPETLAYRESLVAELGLEDVRDIIPDAVALAREDAAGDLWRRDADRCCHLRKVAPLARALEGFDAWVTGRKRFHGDVRSDLPLFENDGKRIKINPLADWSANKVAAWIATRGLSTHPLLAEGFASIGCAPCTAPADARGGRWSGSDKTECGIHQRRKT
jgi:phosphoadenylyl-sulfate reductase (thioredoxin)